MNSLASGICANNDKYRIRQKNANSNFCMVQIPVKPIYLYVFGVINYSPPCTLKAK